MENVIFLVIAVVAFIINTLLNYQKEQKKNAERTKNQPPKPNNAPKTIIYEPRGERPKVVQSQKMTEVLNTPQVPKKEFSSTLERASAVATETTLLNKKYQSEDSIYNLSDESNSIFAIDERDEIGNEDLKENTKAASIKLETRDDFKKAIIYSTILERKY